MGSANPCLSPETNILSHKILQCPFVPLTAPRGGLGSPDVCRSDFLSSLQVASFFVALVVMVTMLSLGIYLEPLPKVRQTSVQAEPLQHSLSTPRHSLAPKIPDGSTGQFVPGLGTCLHGVSAIIESQNHTVPGWFVLERTLNLIPAMGSDIFHYSSLLQALSKLALGRDEAATISLNKCKF